MELSDLVGTSLGSQSHSYTDRDVMLYAIAVGAPASRLDLMYEAELAVLPTFGLALGLWVVETAHKLGAYDPLQALHAAQSLQVRKPLPVTGTVGMDGQITAVWDKGKAAMVDVELSCDYFAATYSIFLPGRGGWGGPRGPATQAAEHPSFTWSRRVPTSPNQAALYRLTGDRHPLHVDPAIARSYGFDRPILHGLCTLGVVARELADAAQSAPSSLLSLQVRFAAPVYPGDTLAVAAVGGTDGQLRFEVSVDDTVVLRDGMASFQASPDGAADEGEG